MPTDEFDPAEFANSESHSEAKRRSSQPAALSIGTFGFIISVVGSTVAFFMNARCAASYSCSSDGGAYYFGVALAGLATMFFMLLLAGLVVAAIRDAADKIAAKD